MRINDEDFPALAERLALRELERLARMMMALFPDTRIDPPTDAAMGRLRH